MAGGVFLGSAYVEQVGCTCGVVLPLAQPGGIDACHVGTVGHGAGADGCLFTGLLADFTETPRLAVLQLLAGEGPADGAVAQRGYRVGDAGIYQRLRADQAAGTPGAVDDHPRGRIRRQFGDAQHQLSAGHADPAGDAHVLIFVEAAGIQHHHVGLRIQQRLHFLGGQ
ncbi:hypothetical protein D3C78_1201230 [compost metagenome]